MLNKVLIGLYSFLAVFIIGSLATGSTLVQDNTLVFVLAVLLVGLVFIINNLASFLEQFKSFKKVDIIILFSVTILLLITSILWDDTIFGIFTTLAGVLTVIQASRGSIWTFFWGSINVLFYAMIAYFSDYAGDFVINAFFNVPMQVVGIYFWNKNYKVEVDEVKKRVFSKVNYLYTLVALLVGTILIGKLMPLINNALFMDSNPLPFVDALTTTAQILGQVLMTMRYREQWLLWIILNTGSIVMWLYKGDITMVIMFGAYLLNAIFGYIKWSEE